MNRRKVAKLFRVFLVLLLVSGFFVAARWAYAAAEGHTGSGGVTVQMNVPAPGGGGGGGGGGDNFPSITDVVVSAAQTTAKLAWKASDDFGIKSVLLEYGLTGAYGASTTPSNDGGNYEANLAGLTPDTTYYYKITVTDTNNQSATSLNTFKTLKVGEAPPGGDQQPPALSNIQVAPGSSTTSISWDTDEPADTQVNYGLTAQYGDSAVDDALGLQHSVLLLNLLPHKTYHFRVISTDAAGNSAASADDVFITLKDNTPPPDVSNLLLEVKAAALILSWSNPGPLAAPDFDGVKVTRKIGSRSQNPADGTAVYGGQGQTFTDDNVVPGADYYYTVYSFDTSENYSGGIFEHGTIAAGGVEICNNGADDDGDGFIDCQDPNCAGAAVCQAGGAGEICDNGVDDNNNGLADCADPACVNAAGCHGGPGGGRVGENCFNKADDDGDGLIDCDDAECFGFAGCVSAAQIFGGAPVFVNVPDFARIHLWDVTFLTGGRKIELKPRPAAAESFYHKILGFPSFDIFSVQVAWAAEEENFSQAIISLAGSNFTVVIPKKALAAAPQSVILKIDNSDQHLFVYHAEEQEYYADIAFPPIGRHQLAIEIDYGFGQRDGLGVFLDSLPLGDVTDSGGRRLEGVALTLYRADGFRFPAEEYGGQSNPWRTDINGMYGWVVPNGGYFLIAVKEGYYERRVSAITVDNNVLNLPVRLVAVPPSLSEVIKSDAPLVENVTEAAANLTVKILTAARLAAQNIGDAVRITGDVADRPAVETAVSRVAAPAVVGASAASALAATGFNIFSLLRFLFFQPILLLGRRKREKWGQVYNSLNKLPVDLATVRLLEAASGRVVQSRVTGRDGRYIFIARPGRYRLLAQKSGLLFPSLLLKEAKYDGRKTDIYHGEIIEVTEANSVITANIPLDPVGVVKTPRRIVWDRRWRIFQLILSWTGLVVTVVSIYVYPRWYTFALAFLHLAIFLLFRRLAIPPQVKGWGIVYDTDTKKPLGRAVARLFDAQFNKLVDTKITDKNGRYNFLAGESRYYATYEHAEYEAQKSITLDLSGKEQDIIALDVGLKKKNPGNGAATGQRGAPPSRASGAKTGAKTPLEGGGELSTG